jgi:putative ABC transport system permease protein
MDPAAARRQALVELEGVEQVKERVRDVRRGAWLEQARQDVRYALRLVRRDPGLTTVVVLTLALGIGATTAMFTVVNGVLFEPLPYPAPERLMTVYGASTMHEHQRVSLSAADFLDWRARNHIFEPVAAYANALLNYTGPEGPEQIGGLSVTADFFAALGVAPALGRTFLPAEDRPGTELVAVVSDAFWRRHLHADPNRIGQPIGFSGRSYVLVGVMPPSFRFGLPQEAGAWVSMKLAPPTRRGPYFLRGLGRLKRGASEEQMRRELATIAGDIREQAKYTNWSLAAINMRDALVGDVRRALLIMLGAVVLVLAIACANVANLLLARSTVREKEVALRAALGAGRARLVRQLLTECLLLGGMGGAAGLLLAYWGTGALLALAPASIPRLQSVHIDARMLAFATTLSLVSAVLFGLAPMIQSSRPSLIRALKEGRSAGEGAHKRRVRGALVVAEVALSLMLLMGAGLLVRSFSRLQNVDIGINADRVVSMQISLPGSRYPEPAQRVRFYSQMLDRIEAVPGVQSAAITLSLPPDQLQVEDTFIVEGRPAPRASNPLADLMLVSPQYFRVMGIRLLEGREFTHTDTADAPRVVIINETMRRRFFADENPIGKRIKQTAAENPSMEIVGIATDVKYAGVGAATNPAMYEPYMQNPGSPMFLVVRAAADPLRLMPSIRGAIWSVDKDLPVTRVRTIDELVYRSKAEPRFRAMLLSLFGAAALILAAVGIYGVVSYSVTQRTHEIGVRMALGARHGDVIRLVLVQGLTLVVGGIGIGLAGAAVASRLLGALLFEIGPHDPMTFASVAALLVVAALSAVALPAARATRVDPLDALRTE